MMYSRRRTARTELKTSIREFPKINLLVTYIPPNVNSEQAIQQVVDIVSDLQAKSPDSVTIIRGDFNHNTLENELPLFFQYIDCPTRGKNILDLCYGNFKDAYKCKALPGLGKSDHQMMQLTPKYGTVLKKSKVDKQVVSVWNAENTEMLQECFDCTDWTGFEDSCANIDELTDSITEYIKFCENVTIKKKEIVYFPNSKPWLN
ncbi:ReO_6 protein [Elysia marginata]|uniref:ReO_6 protein n=1 Tax=Elysia marginata TaxID=1093978 RepID=A0AAV4FM19_9GAST|nr:ReO_6 protein [Elysia marginata]